MHGSTDRSGNLMWFLSGMRGIFSPPALILMVSYVGFCAFAAQSGVSWPQAIVMTATIWALPAQMILIGSLIGGVNLGMAFLAVTLSSIRMMPMVASLVPEIRSRNTPVWLLLLLSHFIAITSWVFSMQHLQTVPREGRLAYFAGFSVTLTSINILIVALAFRWVSEVPPVIGGALYFLTPSYFLMSIWHSGKQPLQRLAFVIGLVTGPVCAMVWPEVDILVAGIGGGTLAYGIDRMRRNSKRKEIV